MGGRARFGLRSAILRQGSACPPRLGGSGSGWRGYSRAEELVCRERIAVEDEDAFVIERKFGGLPWNFGCIDGGGVLIAGLAEEGGHSDRLERFYVVGRLGRRRDVDVLSRAER